MDESDGVAQAVKEVALVEILANSDDRIARPSFAPSPGRCRIQ